MKPKHPSAAGICLLTIEPETRKAGAHLRWIWTLKQVVFDKGGEKRKEINVEVSSRRAALEAASEQIFQCLTASVELVVEFTETTGDHEWKRYNIDGTAETVLTPRPDIPPARCAPLPTTEGEEGQRRQAAKPVGPPGRRPPRVGAGPQEIPSIQGGVPAGGAIPGFVQGYIDAENAGRGMEYLLSIPKQRGVLSAWFAKRPHHPLADVLYDAVQEIRAGALVPVAAPHPARPVTPKPTTGRLAVEWGPLVAGALAQTSVAEMAAYLAGLAGGERQALAGKIRRKGIPAHALQLWEQAVAQGKAARDQRGVPPIVARFLAYADSVGDDPSLLRAWLAALPLDECRGIGGQLRATGGVIPARAVELYTAARNAPPPAAAVRPSTRKPTPVVVAPPPRPAEPPSKLATYATHYQKAVQQGTGATFLTSLSGLVRSNLRKYLENRVGDPVLLAAFDRDAPQRRPETVVIPPAPVPPRPRTPTPPPPPVSVRPPTPPPEVYMPSEPPVPPPAPPSLPPAPAAPALGPDLAALMAQMQASMGSIVSAIDKKAEEGGNSEKLRTRSLFH